MNTSWRARYVGSCAVLSVGIWGLACDEKTESKAQAETAPTAAPAPIPTPVAAPEPAPEPPKPKKKFEDCPKDPELKLDNEELEAAIRVKAQKPEGNLTTADLARLRSLNLSRVAIDELDVCLFHHMTELRELFLGPSGIEDLSPISRSTKLESLGVARNPIEDLAPLEKMTRMDRLDLAKTEIDDLSVLQNMPDLTELNIDKTKIEDLGPLKELKQLERLSIQHTEVDDLSALKDHENLRFVYVAGSPIANDPAAQGVVVKNGAKILEDQ